MRQLSHLLLLLLAVLPLGVAAPASAQDTTDKDALVALYNATDGANWTTNTNWTSEQPLSEWHGVITLNGRVVGLSLTRNGLNGTLPVALEDLTELTVLSLADNSLAGALPAELANLSELIFLNVSYNSDLTVRFPGSW